MKANQIARRRMVAHRLWGSRLTTPEDVVHHLMAMQGQDIPIAKWAVAQRARGATDGDVDRALAEGAVLRTHVLRPTWHFVTPPDIRWLLALTGPRVHRLNANVYGRLDLDEALLKRTDALLVKALQGGEHMTRKEIGAVLGRDGIEASGLRLGYILMRAELDAVVCSGAPKGKQQTYALLDERVPPAPSMGRDEALAELIRRYFVTRGPATAKDLARWSSLTLADVRRGIDMVGQELEQLDVDGRTYLMAPDTRGGRPRSGEIDLIQGLDEYVMSYSESRDAMAGPSPLGNPGDWAATFPHVILLNGQLIGHWKPLTSKGSVVIEASLERPLNDVESRALNAATARYGRFLGKPVTVAG
jgi:hypothetical protein